MPTIQQLVRKGRVKMRTRVKLLLWILAHREEEFVYVFTYHSEKTELSHEKGCPC